MIRVYMEGDALSHVVTKTDNDKALCGRNAWPGYWLDNNGAAMLPLCTACVRKAGNRK